MRPLEHLKTGIDNPDLDLFLKDESLYDELMERGEQILTQAFKEYMGEFCNLPKETKKELECQLDRELKRKEQLSKLEVPNNFIEYHDNRISEIANRLAEKDFASSHADYAYRESYYKKQHNYYSSDKHDNIVNDILSYNEQKYRELLDTVSERKETK